MKCGEVVRFLLQRCGDAPGVQEHLAQCRHCREKRSVICSLEAMGQEARGSDLSVARCRETRRQILSISGRRTRLHRLFPPLPLMLRPALAAALPLLVLGAGLTWYVWHDSLSRPGDGKETVPTTWVNRPIEFQYDSDIEKLSRSVDASVKRLRSRRRYKRQRTDYAVRAAELKSRMTLCSLRIERELQSTRNGTAADGAGGFDEPQPQNDSRRNNQEENDDHTTQDKNGDGGGVLCRADFGCVSGTA